METPNSRITQALRQLWLRSKERGECLKQYNYTCNRCKRKKTTKQDFDPNTQTQKIEVHHKEGVLNWDEMHTAIRKYLLVSPDKLECLCKECRAGAVSSRGRGGEQAPSRSAARNPPRNGVQ